MTKHIIVQLKPIAHTCNKWFWIISRIILQQKNKVTACDFLIL
jgi:hypothetical protein